jgi:ribonuclease HI
MSFPAPHFLLTPQAAVRTGDGDYGPAGQWRFVLQTASGETCLEAEDDEPESSPERLELLAIVRGLEALDQPARVTLVSARRSISRGMRYGLAQWRESDWQWERYGKLTPVKNGDLWRRIDRAMSIHAVECREPAGALDDLAVPPCGPLAPREDIRSRSERTTMPDEAPDVRIIRHRGRKLRIDGTHRSSTAPVRPTRSCLPPNAGPLARLAAGLVRFARLAARALCGETLDHPY